MMKMTSLVRFNGVDVGYKSLCERGPKKEGVDGREGVGGFNKDISFDKIIEKAQKYHANIIVKGGPNAKWYLKYFPVEDIQTEIKKQAWRCHGRATMWLIEFDE